MIAQFKDASENIDCVKRTSRNESLERIKDLLGDVNGKSCKVNPLIDFSVKMTTFSFFLLNFFFFSSSLSQISLDDRIFSFLQLIEAREHPIFSTSSS